MLRAISVVKRTQLRSITQTLTFPISLHSYSYSSSKRQTKDNKDKDDLHDVVTLFNRDPDDPPRLFLVQPRLKPPTFLQAKLNEALCLANSLEEQRDGYFDTDFFDKELPPHVVVQNPSLKSGKARADTFFGPGTVETIKCHINGAESKGELDAIFVNAILSGIQQRNLEATWGKPVLDRVGLIIEIFNAHAHTKEAKLQAELAALMYKKSRLVRVRGPDGRLTFGETGEAEVVSARGRGSGGRGFISGAGETELQLQRRRRKVLLSDTVGFISDLPLQLVDAFHATLEEVVEADLLVHVLDCTAPNLEEHRTTVLQVLQQVGVSEEKLKNMIEVWNKIDYHDEEMGDVEYIDGDDISNFSRAEDEVMTSEPVDVECIDNYGGDDADNNDGFVSEDLGESINKNHNDYSDGWLLSGDEQDNVEEEFWKAAEDQQPESTKDVCVMEKDSQSQDQHAPDVKISARTGVGLRELLEIIDERLKTLDDKQKSPNVVERDFFNKKWRPPRTEDSSVAVQ
ncbi:GTP-binding protein At3g49725, chloroplastic isoform X3 [Citrus sinensis]|uniref:GTP-binding protein At3g49725, chloroplastic isoform X3 n=1 Tax=Citrus sinensis TaxID=2711 RepID=UPI002279539B|nr:GTP-binding protein At3g49725, chloroplastic isoform X3 [Citrus sinensis]